MLKGQAPQEILRECATATASKLRAANNLQLDLWWKRSPPLVKNLSPQLDNTESKAKMGILFILNIHLCVCVIVLLDWL